MQLRKKFVMALLPFLTSNLSDDAFHEMLLCCYEVSIYRCDYTQKVTERIVQKRKSIAAENALLYKRAGNIQLDQCIGDSNILMAERIDLSEWDEWNR